jgi:hypothetical protein
MVADVEEAKPKPQQPDHPGAASAGGFSAGAEGVAPTRESASVDVGGSGGDGDGAGAGTGGAPDVDALLQHVCPEQVRGLVMFPDGRAR